MHARRGRVDRSAQREIRIHQEREQALANQRAQFELELELSRRDHELRILLIDKLFLTVIVGVLVSAVAFGGNFLLERHKSIDAARTARVLAIRTASNEVWGKISVFRESVLNLKSTLRDLEFHRGVASFKDEAASDMRAFDNQNKKAEQDLSVLLHLLRSQQMNLGPGMHSRFFRAMQDLSVMRNIYTERFQEKSMEESKEKSNEEIADEAHKDLNEQEKELLAIMENLY